MSPVAYVENPVPPLADGNVPVTPVDNGKPVALVKVTDVGVPKIGVTSVGDVDKTTDPEPVEDVTPVPPLATASVPATVTAPEVAVDGVKPVVPKDIVLTGLEAALDASNLTVPELFLKYNFSSAVLIANSPATRLAANG